MEKLPAASHADPSEIVVALLLAAAQCSYEAGSSDGLGEVRRLLSRLQLYERECRDFPDAAICVGGKRLDMTLLDAARGVLIEKRGESF